MNIYIIIELSSIILFLAYLIHARKNNKLNLLFYAALFAFVFENSSLLLFANQAGGYFYNDNFNIFIWKTPLFIILLWSLIIYSSNFIIGKIVSGRAFYFLVSLYILVLDLVLDQVATALKLWTWIGFENYQGIFSVPASNYIGWLILPFLFFVTREILKDKKSLILQPFLAFLLFILFSLPLHFLKINFFDENVYVQYGILSFFIVLFIIYSIVKAKKAEGAYVAKRDFSLFAIRIYLHLFTLLGLWHMGVFEHLKLVIAYLLILMFEFYILKRYRD